MDRQISKQGGGVSKGLSYNYSLVHQQPGIPLNYDHKNPNFHLNNVITDGPYTGSSETLVTEQLLLQLTDCDSLDQIKVISLRNKMLQTCLRILSKCENLSIGYLQGNSLNLADLIHLQNFSHLKKIDLSFNQISVLPQAHVFSGLINLKFFYLHNNNISNWNDITSLTALPSIIHLTLFSNPVCTIPGYRHYIVNSVQSLLALDNYVITDEERIEDASFGYRFRGLNEYMKLHIPDYAKEKSAESHLFNLEVDIYRLRRIFERNSPSILIQSLYRGYRSRNFVKIYFNERKNKIVKIQKVVRGWLLRKKLKADLRDVLAYTKQEYLMLSNQEIRMNKAALVIYRIIHKWWRARQRRKLELASCLQIQKYFRGRFTKNTSFINALELQKYPKIYFLKEQKPLFVKILKSLMPLFENREDIKFDDLLSFIKDDNKYDTLRIAEPDLFSYRSLPLVQLVKPSVISRVRYNKQPPSVKNPNFTLSNFYFKPNRMDIYQKLKILQKRGCFVKKQKIQKVYEEQKKNPFKNQYLFQDQYKDLLVFETSKLEIIITLCFAILDYNRQNHLDQENSSQLLIFFESLLNKVASATKIQQAFRSYLFRQKLAQYPVERIIQKRAAHCIQSWWSNLKLQKRMIALQKIKRHIDKIKSTEIFIEQSLYSNIANIASLINTQMRFEEQNINFDFSSNGTYQVCMYVLEKERIDQPQRYLMQTVPGWFNLNLKAPDFDPSPYQNNVLAFFHYNEGDCELMPSNYVLKHGHPHLDINRNLYFLKIKCHSVEEARRRATVMAYLTYNIHRHLFVQLSTAEMLEDPFIMQNIYKIQQIYGIDESDANPTPLSLGFDLAQKSQSIADIDMKSVYYQQTKQQHQGLILSEKDGRLA